jgi:hypothetical protein
LWWCWLWITRKIWRESTNRKWHFCSKVFKSKIAESCERSANWIKEVFQWRRNIWFI